MKPTKTLVFRFIRLLTIAAVVFVFSIPAFAYEEDTHFIMTYVICRSVGFTPQEAMIVAAADQGMDDSNGTSPMGIDAASVASQWMWHALDRGGDMNATGILARRDQLFQDALKETTLRNKLIRLGVFFHYQQDTWAHRHHYDTIMGVATTSYDSRHLSRNNYITYNTPTGHAKDGHHPDRPPFDPVAALMNLEDGIVYARTFLKQGLGREPGTFLANYTPQGGSDDSAWNNSKKGAYFHQINMSGTAANSPRHYLLSLIRAQIDAYDTSFSPNPVYTPRYTPDLADLDRVRIALEKVCKNFEPFRQAGIFYPTIQIPQTSEKTAQGFNTLTTAMLTAALPNTAQLVGAGTDKFLYTRATLASPWVQVPNSGLVTSVAVLRQGTILGVGTDNFLHVRTTLTDSWVKIPNSGSIIAVTSLPTNMIVGVKPDKVLYTWDPVSSSWIKVPNSGSVIGIATMMDGTLLGVGNDNSLYTRASLKSNWVKVANSGSVIAVTVLQDGTILGVGTDQMLYIRAKLNSSWVKIPDSGFVTSVAEMRLAK